jgi:hypothetical protein
VTDAKDAVPSANATAAGFLSRDGSSVVHISGQSPGTMCSFQTMILLRAAPIQFQLDRLADSHCRLFAGNRRSAIHTRHQFAAAFRELDSDPPRWRHQWLGWCVGRWGARRRSRLIGWGCGVEPDGGLGPRRIRSRPRSPIQQRSPLTWRIKRSI